MDYKVNESGKIVWYKLIGDSEVPTQVSLDMVLHIFCILRLNIPLWDFCLFTSKFTFY